MYKGGFVYIITDSTNSVLYTGITSDLYGRMKKHKEKYYSNSFSAKNNCYKLVYFEGHWSITKAFAKESRIKNWKREWKIDLINSMNPEWKELPIPSWAHPRLDRDGNKGS